MKKSIIIKFIVGILVIATLYISVITYFENNLTTKISKQLQKSSIIEYKTCGVKILTSFPTIEIELTNSKAKFGKRIITSKNIKVYYNIFNYLSKSKYKIKEIEKIISPVNCLKFKLNKLNTEIYFDIELTNNKNNYNLKSNITKLRIDTQEINLPKIELLSNIIIDRKLKGIKITNGKLNINDMTFDINSCINKKYISYNINKEYSEETNLLLPSVLFSNINRSSGKISFKAQSDSSGSSILYKCNDSKFSIKNNDVTYNLLYIKNKNNQNSLKFNIQNISNNEIKNLNYFKNIKEINKYFTGKFNIKGDFKINTTKPKILNIVGSGNINSKICVVKGTKLQDLLRKRFGSGYNILNIRNINLRYKYHSGKLIIDKCDLIVNKMRWQIKGEISNKQELNLLLSIKVPFSDIIFPNETKDLATFAINVGLIKKDKIIGLDLNILGTIKKPLIRLDLNKIINKTLGSKNKKSNKRLENNINKFINKFFN